MIETIDIELNGLEYQVEVDVTEEYVSYNDDDYDAVDHDLEVVDIYLVRKRKVYRVSNEYVWEEINNLDLLECYFEQCK